VGSVGSVGTVGDGEMGEIVIKGNHADIISALSYCRVAEGRGIAR